MDLAAIRGKQIALGVCGGIAAYKVVELARTLTLAGADVRVVMSPSALNFVGEITFSTLTGNPVRTQLFPPEAPSQIPHTDLGRTSDLVVIAPATAKTMAKYAQGISEDLMSALLLSASCPIIMAPAMHTEMWEDPATRENVGALRARGVRFVGPTSGALAGPDVGVGRLADIADIVAAIADELSRKEDLTGLRVLITSGGTREAIDTVRYLGNRSSGKMGTELAFEALRRGAKVTLVSGPTALPLPEVASVIRVESAQEMRDATVAAASEANVIIMAAAVSDWRPAKVAVGKLPKSDGAPIIELEPTPDILAELSSARHVGQVIVGFCAQTEDLERHARGKLESKGLDLIVGNLVGRSETGFDADTNEAILIDRSGRVDQLALMSKRQMAREILDAVVQRFLTKSG